MYALRDSAGAAALCVVVEVGLLQIAAFSPGTQQTSTIGDVKLDHLVHSFQRGQVEDTIQSFTWTFAYGSDLEI